MLPISQWQVPEGWPQIQNMCFVEGIIKYAAINPGGPKQMPRQLFFN